MSLDKMLETHRVSLYIGSVDLFRKKWVEIHICPLTAAELLLICFSKPNSFMQP
jgi:hypothetical protein